MAGACTASLAACAVTPDGYLECVAVLLAHGADVSHKHLIELTRVFTLDELNKCFIDVLSSVDNPFIPGMTLSVAFDDAAPKASETEARTLWALMETIDNVLLEVSSVIQALFGSSISRVFVLSDALARPPCGMASYAHGTPVWSTDQLSSSPCVLRRVVVPSLKCQARIYYSFPGVKLPLDESLNLNDAQKLVAKNRGRAVLLKIYVVYFW